MGENKASYLTKSYVDKIPTSDQKEVGELKKGVGNAAGGALQNPLGGFVSLTFLACFMLFDMSLWPSDLTC